MSQGESLEELQENIRDAYALMRDDAASGVPIPEDHQEVAMAKHPRVFGDGQSNYHVLSRVIERRFIFGEQEQEYFKKVMRAQEAFSGVRVLTWTCMSNHFIPALRSGLCN